MSATAGAELMEAFMNKPEKHSGTGPGSTEKRFTGIPAAAPVAARGTPDRQSRELRRLVAARQAIARMLGEKAEE
jgi:hypothetical protein